MDIRHLKCFHAVMAQGTVTEAATILGISQPAVSMTIRALEREVGFRLFLRANARLKPTAEANHLLEDVKGALGAVDRFTQAAQAIRNQTRGNLVIASYPGLALDFLPGIVSEFLQSRPGVRVELFSRSAHVIHELIPAQRFDVAIVDLPINRSDVVIKPLNFECVCVLPKMHPLARKVVVTPTDLAGIPFFALFKEHVIHYRLANAFAVANAHWNVVAECRFFASACAFVKRGWGATIVDPITAAEFGNAMVVSRPFRPRISYQTGLVFPRYRPRSRLTRSFVELFEVRVRPYLSQR